MSTSLRKTRTAADEARQPTEARVGWKALVCVAVAALLSGAGCGAAAAQLEHRASLDLRCPADKVQIVAIDSTSKAARGCGQRGVYIEHCDQRGCSWVLQSKHLE